MNKKLLYASNRLGEIKDYFKFAFQEYGHNRYVKIAVPYFTESSQLIELVQQGCDIDLIVDLNQATSSSALEQIMLTNGIRVRYVYDLTGRFHSKLYIFGSEIAFVGSSNLTTSGLEKNIELNVGIEGDDPRFTVLENIFNEYWEHTRVLDEKTLKNFKEAQENSKKITDPVKDYLRKSVSPKSFDEVQAKDIGNKIERKIELFAKHYQYVVDQYKKLIEYYTRVNKRKSNILPLLWEIDQFLSWLYMQKDVVDSKNFDSENLVSRITEFMVTDFKFIETMETCYVDNAEAVRQILEKKLTPEGLKNFMRGIHAFESRKRYFVDSSNMLNSFLDENSLSKIQITFHYLLFGTGSAYERMARCIYDEKYQLKHIGESCIKEIYGRNNSDDFPICNERTIKAMRKLGFNV